MQDVERFVRKNKNCCAGIAELHQTAIFIGVKPRLVFSFKDLGRLHFVAAFLNRIQVLRWCNPIWGGYKMKKLIAFFTIFIFGVFTMSAASAENENIEDSHTV